jgi:cyclopropane fatty-acyl-phospholipid synthase-like methyltransferase
MLNLNQTDAASTYQNGSYLENNPTWHEEDSPWKAEKILDLLNKNGVKPRTIAEIGCGAGGILRSLADYDPESICHGYEISSDAYELCKKKSQINLQFFHEDLLSKELNEEYDLLLAIDVFEHVEDYIGFLRKLKPRGRYKVFHIPLDLSVQAVLRVSPIEYSRNKYGHLHHFTKEIALSTLMQAGYEIVDCRYTSGSLELGYLGWKTRLLKLPRKFLFAVNQDFAVRLLGGFSLIVLAR